MTSKAKSVLATVRAVFSKAVITLNPSDYRAVMEELEEDMRSRLEALNEEEAAKGGAAHE